MYEIYLFITPHGFGKTQFSFDLLGLVLPNLKGSYYPSLDMAESGVSPLRHSKKTESRFWF
jgi:hypothetical protein